MGPSESIYKVLFVSCGRITEELKFEVTRGVYVEVVLNFRAGTVFL